MKKVLEQHELDALDEMVNHGRDYLELTHEAQNDPEDAAEDAETINDALRALRKLYSAQPNRDPKPGQPKLPGHKLSLIWANGDRAAYRYWVRVLNFREPKKGEFYLSGALPEIFQAPNSLSTKFWIVEILEDPEPQNCHEYT